MKSSVLQNIIEFAINREIEAAQFYSDLQLKTNSPSLKNLTKELEEMEKDHINILKKIFNENSNAFDSESAGKLKLSDFQVEDSEKNDLNEIIKIAMKREEKSFNLYSAIAEKYLDVHLKNVFLKLADEEASHKSILENYYYNEILK
ncbi:MAG TPA: ferritin family protein [Candidatus Kapabacteria bacterium]|nr:ferritin family protein [Candidatus Kapabacteria bacterium]